MSGILSVIVALVLTAPFGDATAAAIDTTDGMTIDVTVEVVGTYEAVLIRPFSTFEELAPTALQNLGGNEWGGAVALPTAEDWFVVFDAIEPDGTSVRSDTALLSDLGVDPVVIAGEPEAPVSRSIDSSTWWLIIGAVLALAALGALAWWTFSDGSEVASDSETGTDTEPEVDPVEGDPSDQGSAEDTT
jgi:hypothetical protein